MDNFCNLTHWVKNEYVDSALKGEFVTKPHFIKPKGLWLSWNNGWEDWCKPSQSGWVDSSRTCLKASLKPGIKIWVIDSLKTFMKMWKSYSSLSPELVSIIAEKEVISNFWEFLKKKGYEGIAITSYGQVDTRMTTFLYGWDCESVVIFEPEGRVKLNLL